MFNNNNTTTNNKCIIIIIIKYKGLFYSTILVLQE